MGQKFGKRVFFKLLEPITSSINDDRQEVADTRPFRIGDVVDILQIDANGNITNKIADNLTIQAIEPNSALVFSAPVDTTVGGDPIYVFNQTLKTQQKGLDRALRPQFDGSAVDCVQNVPIVNGELNTPSAGQTKYEVDDIKKLIPGDTVDVLDVGGGWWNHCLRCHNIVSCHQCR